jgi:hypothetical protein
MPEDIEIRGVPSSRQKGRSTLISLESWTNKTIISDIDSQNYMFCLRIQQASFLDSVSPYDREDGDHLILRPSQKRLRELRKGSCQADLTLKYLLFLRGNNSALQFASITSTLDSVSFAFRDCSIPGDALFRRIPARYLNWIATCCLMERYRNMEI